MSRSPRLVLHLLLSGVALLAALAVLEVGFRLVRDGVLDNPRRLVDAREFLLGHRVALYQPWAFTNFRLGEVDTHLRADGFMSTVDLQKRHDGARVRIAFIGGSTTFGFFYTDSFPYFVERLLRQRGIVAEAMNCGVPAWTSAENLVHYALSIQDYTPDWIVIHQGANDVRPRLYPDFRSDYGHLRRPFSLPAPGRLTRALAAHSDLYVWLLMRLRLMPTDIEELADEPLPPPERWRLTSDSLEVFRRNTISLIRLAEAGGARVLLTTESHNRRPRRGEEVRTWERTGMDEENEVVRNVARSIQLPLADTERVLDYHGPLFKDYVHVIHEGDVLKARVVVKALMRAGLRRAHSSSGAVTMR